MTSILQPRRYYCHCNVTDWFGFFYSYDPNEWNIVEHVIYAEQTMELMELLSEGIDAIRCVGSYLNTPLHVAIIFRKKEMFDLVLRHDREYIHAHNTFDQSPLHLAVAVQDEYMVSELVKAGAHIERCDENGCTPLHMAASKDCLAIFRYLLDHGGRVNASNYYGHTLISHSCELGNRDNTYLAIEYGGNPRTCDAYGVEPLAALMMRSTSENVTQEILDYHTHMFNLTFPEGSTVTCLEIITAALHCRSPLTAAIVEKIQKISFTNYSLVKFSRFAMLFDFEQIKLVSKKVPDLLERITIEPVNLCALLWENECNHEELAEKFLTFLHNLFECSDDYNFLKRPSKFDHFIPHLIFLYKENKLSKETVTKIIHYLYNHGLKCELKDFVRIYETFKFCDLFKLMLEFDIVDTGNHPPGCMSYIIYNFRLTAKDVLSTTFYGEVYHLNKISQKKELLRYFASPAIQEYFRQDASLTEALDALPKVPSLRQLARDATRQAIIEEFKCKTCQDFHKAVRMLPVADAFKEIITYQRPLYNFER